MKKNITLARTLRKQPTDAEIKLWHKIRCRQLYGARFRRQVSIGRYIVDFLCFEARLIIELDGGQHNEIENMIYDEKRTQWLQKQGYRLIRFWNNEIFQEMDAVLEHIANNLQASPPIPTFPRKGGRRY